MFKYWRTYACWITLTKFRDTSVPNRANDRSVQFAAGIVHILGGLLYRKNLGTPWPEVERHLATYQLEDADSDLELDYDDFEGPDMIPVGDRQGILFFATIDRTHGTYTCSPQRIMDPDLLSQMYGCPDIHALALQFGVHSIRRRITKAHPERRNNRQTRTTDLTDARTEPPTERNFGLQAKGIRLIPTRLVSRASERARAGSHTSDEVLNDIWESFKSDIIQKAPQPKSKTDPPYLTIDPYEKVNTPDAIFQSPEIPFRKASLVLVSGAHWSGRLFSFYFPGKGQMYPGRVQNLDACTYLQKWNSTVLAQQDDVVTTVRDTLRKHFCKMLWMPLNESERMWTTKSVTADRGVMCPPNAKPPCPVLALNEALCGGLDFKPRARPEAIPERAFTVSGGGDGGGGRVDDVADEQPRQPGGNGREGDGRVGGYTREQIMAMREEEEEEDEA